MTRLFGCIMLAAFLLMACKGKSKKNMSGDDTVTAQDFIEFFDEIQLPFSTADSTLKKKVTDSSLIGNTVFNQFVGDSIFKPLYGGEKPKIYALGRFQNKEEEIYLLLKATGSTHSVYAVAFTPEKKYSAHILLLSNSKKANEVNRAVIDTKYTFTLVDQYKGDDGSLTEYSTVYAYNNAGLFMIILKDGLKKGEIMPIINPIDTFDANNKYSGNYGKDKRNFISIRDGKTPKDFIFFLNFDKGVTSDCKAELKGEAVFVTKDSAIYKGNNDPCTVGFKFTGNAIRISETGVCGSRRPAECTFNAYYTKQKEAKQEKKDSASLKNKTTKKKK